MGDDVSEGTGMPVPGGDYDLPYFAARCQDRDRPALWFYERIVRRWIAHGTVLDYGCGTGFLLRRLACHFDVGGYDISPHARKAACQTVPGITVYAREDQIPEAFFSGIVSLHVLEHIDRAVLLATLACWRRSLVTNGRVLCAVPDVTGRGHKLAGTRWIGFGDPTHVTLMGWHEWNALFTSAGFSVCHVGTDGLWNLPYREGKSKLLDGVRFSIPTVIQFLAGRLILPAGSGESSVFLLEKI
jgi:SAM-dependent methyltransferase